mmetsp:Transcript_7935/g.23890  ORF Transcript_7935/g.23890 Transcript_7935/m.23890 type:complete len:235 (-) Transcript_7935:181-885(-)
MHRWIYAVGGPGQPTPLRWAEGGIGQIRGAGADAPRGARGQNKGAGRDAGCDAGNSGFAPPHVARGLTARRRRFHLHRTATARWELENGHVGGFWVDAVGGAAKSGGRSKAVEKVLSKHRPMKKKSTTKSEKLGNEKRKSCLEKWCVSRATLRCIGRPRQAKSWSGSRVVTFLPRITRGLSMSSQGGSRKSPTSATTIANFAWCQSDGIGKSGPRKTAEAIRRGMKMTLHLLRS